MNDIRQQVTTEELNKFNAFIEVLSSSNRKLIHQYLSNILVIRTKADNSLVTGLDIALEKHIRLMIHSHWPDHSIIGEELQDEYTSNSWCWVVDPIDGTEEMVRGHPYWGIIIGLFYHNEPVASLIDHPQLDQRYIAIYGQGAWDHKGVINTEYSVTLKRIIITLPAFEDFLKHPSSEQLFLKIVNQYPNYRVFRSCYDHSQVANGGFDAGCEIGVKQWDLAATRLLMEETGNAYHCELCPGYKDRYIAIFGKDQHVKALRNIFDTIDL